MQQAVFSLKNYSVVKVMLDLENIPPQCIFDLKIEPSGIYFQRERQYVLIWYSRLHIRKKILTLRL